VSSILEPDSHTLLIEPFRYPFVTWTATRMPSGLHPPRTEGFFNCRDLNSTRRQSSFPLHVIYRAAHLSSGLLPTPCILARFQRRLPLRLQDSQSSRLKAVTFPNTFQIDGTLIDIRTSYPSYFLFSLSSVLDSRIIIFTTSYDVQCNFRVRLWCFCLNPRHGNI